jgi:hypothetical protein
VQANYLYLAQECPRHEAANKSKWKRLAGSLPYDVIVATASTYANDLARAKLEFGGRIATTPRKLLFDNVVSKFVPSIKTLEENPYFVEPDIVPTGGKTSRALTYIASGLRSSTTGRSACDYSRSAGWVG